MSEEALKLAMEHVRQMEAFKERQPHAVEIHEWQERDDLRGVLSRAVIAQAEEIERLRMLSRSCPCHHTTPCHDRCACVNGFSSSGCRRCALYGSAEQQRAAAERLARQVDEIGRLKGALIQAADYLDGEGFDEAAAELRRLVSL